MANIAAIRWLTRGRYKPPVIQYMLLNDKFEYLITPRELLVNHLETNLKQIFFALEKFSPINSLNSMHIFNFNCGQRLPLLFYYIDHLSESSVD